MAKAIVLFSGGLDSILVIKILEEQKIKVVPICFKSFFFDCKGAKKTAKELKIKLKEIDFSDEHLNMLKKPRYGYGKAINPCLDCHLLMIKQAGKLMKKQKFDFVATGEVLGERPFSQNKWAIKVIEKESGIKGYLLRPLSAKALLETIVEKKGIVDRNKLYAIKGRGRSEQISLAKKFKIKSYPTPAGGCILTEKDYASKLKKLLKNIPNCDGNDVSLLRFGRNFWPVSLQGGQAKFLIIVGRNENDNKEINKLRKKKDIVLVPKIFPGPTVLIRTFGKKANKNIINYAKNLLLRYSKKKPKKPEVLINEV